MLALCLNVNVPGEAADALSAPRRRCCELAIAASIAVVPVLLAVLLRRGVRRAQADTRDAARRQRSPRERAPGRGAEDVRAGDRPPRPGARPALPTAAGAARAAFRSAAPSGTAAAARCSRLRRLVAQAPDRGRARRPQRIAAATRGARRARCSRFSTRRQPARRATPSASTPPRWFDAVRAALQTPVETPEYPGRRFALQCADVAGAVAALARSNGRMLAALAWRGTEVRARDRALAARAVRRDLGARTSRARNPVGGHSRLHLPRRLGARRRRAAATYFVGGVRGLDDRLCKRGDMRGIADDSGHAPRAASRSSGEPTPDMPVDDERWKRAAVARASCCSRWRRCIGRRDRCTALYTDAPPTRPRSPTSYRYGPNRIDIGGSADRRRLLDRPHHRSRRCRRSRSRRPPATPAAQDVCRALGMQAQGRRRRAPSATGCSSTRMVRMAAVAVIDVASGRIEALAGALSPCTRQEYDGPGRSRALRQAPAVSDPLSPRCAAQSGRVPRRHAGARSIKPIMAAAFLSDPEVGARWLAAERAEHRARAGDAVRRDSLRGQLMRSDSARFLDRMFCADKGFARCERPWDVQAMALAFGWNAGCATPRDDCGKHDLLFGRARRCARRRTASAPLATRRPLRAAAGRAGRQAGSARRFACGRATALDTGEGAALRGRCRRPARAAATTGRSAAAAVVVDVVAEGWGQGHARASALGVAGMMATLAAAANGQTEVRRPHLVRGTARRRARRAGATQVGGRCASALADAQPNRIAHDAAEVILSGLSYSHRAGTARLACEQVFDARTCREIDWIAGKTGTPTFPNDDRSLDELARLCAPACREDARATAIACGPLRPYKWYVAAYRTDPDDPRWTKAIGVLTERNWLARHRPHPRRRRSRTQSRGRDRDADRRPPRGLPAGSAPVKRRSRRTAPQRSARTCGEAIGGAARVDVRRAVRDLPRRHRGHAAARDRAGRRRLARSRC